MNCIDNEYANGFLKWKSTLFPQPGMVCFLYRIIYLECVENNLTSDSTEIPNNTHIASTFLLYTVDADK